MLKKSLSKYSHLILWHMSGKSSGVEVIAAICTVVLLKMVGCRVLLISSAAVTCASLSSLGVYEFLINESYCHLTDDPKCHNHLYPLAIASMGAGVGTATCVNWNGAIVITGAFKDYERLLSLGEYHGPSA